MNKPTPEHRHCKSCGNVMVNIHYDTCPLCKLRARIKGTKI